MVNRVCGRVNRTSTVVSMWLQRQSFAIVIALSLIMSGLLTFTLGLRAEPTLLPRPEEAYFFSAA
jgi:hypothetical protein